MTVKTPIAPRQTKPELEHDYVRSPALGYESPETAGFIRCLSHGFPTPLARWHYHDEYELHLITATSGKVFVGDWIGQFQPGHLVLTGPRLPHNWISMDLPEGGVPLRDLALCTDFRLLSSTQLQSEDNDTQLDQINAIVSRITDHLADPLSAADLAQELGMTESRFSRFFRRATGNTFTDFVNLVRVNRACQLLMETERYITHIAYDVGFNNMANFNRRFLDIKGMTPSEYRKQGAGRFGKTS